MVQRRIVHGNVSTGWVIRELRADFDIPADAKEIDEAIAVHANRSDLQVLFEPEVP